MLPKQFETTFKIWEKNRELYSHFLKNYSAEQLNTTPQGFSNNLIWNIGHIIVAQQALFYKGSGLEGYLPTRLYGLYKPGTKPTGKTTENEVEELKHLLISMVEKTKADLEKDIFNTYNERTTGTGFHLQSFEDAIEFNNYHEALHLGFMMNIKKFI